MPESRAEKIERLFHAALEIDSGERAAFLARACSDDPSLREEVESLLAAQEDTSEFLETPAWSMLVDPSAEGAGDLETIEPEEGLPFDRLGEFRLIRRIGEGGMGAVYLAKQEPLDREVALKVIRPERMGSPEMITRFWREVEAMTEIRHPNIVTVYGCGKEKGICYFAMELVPGMGLEEALEEATRRKEKIATPVILGWIKDLARALDRAHEAGIIHRDVKPSNIRITPDGQAMLLDFGVARHVHLASITLTGQFRGTPHYASPEQVKAKRGRIDGRTDIYSLGVTLYEAVVGTVPFDGETTEQVFRQILEMEPLPPRRLNPSLSRDVETIILTAIEKDPDRRYQTMGGFADDLERLFRGEMIQAKPAGLPTKVWKRVRRHPALSAAVGVAGLALLSLFLYVLWSYPQILNERNKALEAKNKAETETEKAKAINEFLEKMLASADPTEGNKDMKVVEALDYAVESIGETFVDQPEVEASLRNTIGHTYKSLGFFDNAVDQHTVALEIYRSALGDEHLNTIATMDMLAIALYRKGDLSEAEQLFKETLEIQRLLLGEEHPDTLTALANLAAVLVHQGDYAGAESVFRETLEVKRRLKGDENSSTLTTMNNLAVLLMNQGKYSESEALFEDLIEIQKRVQGEEHPRTLILMNNLALLLNNQGKFEESTSIQREVLNAQRRKLGEEHPTTLTAMNNLACVLEKQGEFEEAESLHRRALESRRRVLKEGHADILQSMDNLAVVLFRMSRLNEAESIWSESLYTRIRLQGEENPETLVSMNSLATLFLKKNELKKADPLLRKVLEIRTRVLGAAHPETLNSMNTLAELLKRQGNHDEADSMLRKGIEIAQKILPQGITAWVNLSTNYGGSLIKQKRYDEAETLLLKCYEQVKDTLGESHPHSRDVLKGFINLYDAWGKPEKAAEYRELLSPDEDAVAEEG
ncbi:MAG: tetratricopeptide repeat protein [Planctomycetota bacterium]|jgi:tetratricopeptide (TPR) repeat protein